MSVRDAGPRRRVAVRAVRLPGGWSFRVDARALTVSAVLAAATAAAVVATMTTGPSALPVREVFATFVGGGTPGAQFIVLDVRLPRMLTGVLVGAALAVSGALLQSVTRNPLGSPDLVGITIGSATGALVVIVTMQGSLRAISIGAVAGGLATAAVMWALAMRRGGTGFRFVLVGIGVGSMLLAVNQYLITRANLWDAVEAQSWLTGSLHSRTWEHVTSIGVTTAVLLPVAVVLARRLALLELGDDLAAGVGVPVVRTRFLLIGTSVVLAAVATAASGPIAFVALAAPQIARRVTRSPGPGVVSAALTGALLLVASDLAVQRVVPYQLPVGVVTGAIGGLYLAWLLGAQWRSTR